MPRTYLVSIISEQTLPNYLLIKELEPQVDIFLFITTKEMEQRHKTQYIVETAGIQKEKYSKIYVKEDALFLTKNRLDKLNLSYDDKFLVNLTGGTKMIAISVWEYFRQFKNTHFFYVPIGKNIYKEIFTEKEADIYPIKYKVSWEEYLSVYGIKAEAQKLVFTEKQVISIFNYMYQVNFDFNRFPIKKLLEYGFGKLIKTEQLPTRWFEEFLYYKIKKILQLEDSDITAGVLLYEKDVLRQHPLYQSDNQVDVFFVYNNNPFIIEAKSTIGKDRINTKALASYLIKLSAVNRRFGLRARATLMTLANFLEMGENARQHLKVRCKLLNLFCPFDRGKIIDNDLFRENLIEFVK